MTRKRLLHLAAVEHGGGLVHDDEPGVVGQRAGHADDLLARGREAADLRGGRDLAGGRGGRAAPRRRGRRAARREKPNRRLLVAEEDVLGDGQALDQVELLVDGGDAERPWRPAGGDSGRRLAVPRDPALVGLVDAGEHLDQGRLAGAVLAEQAVHLAGAHVEVDAAEGPDAGEALDDAGASPAAARRRCLELMRRNVAPLLHAGQAKVENSSSILAVTCRRRHLPVLHYEA